MNTIYVSTQAQQFFARLFLEEINCPILRHMNWEVLVASACYWNVTELEKQIHIEGTML